MKSGVRILALACAPLKGRDTLLVGIVAKNSIIEGIVSTSVQVDGTDSTKKIISLINGTRFGEQIRLVAVNGLGIAGLNILDVEKVQKKTGVKILSVTRNKPHPSELITALKTFSKLEKKDVSERLLLVGKIKELNEFKEHGFYLQTSLSKADAGKFVKQAFYFVRLAHLIASGVATGESKGRI